MKKTNKECREQWRADIAALLRVVMKEIKDGNGDKETVDKSNTTWNQAFENVLARLEGGSSWD